MKMVECMQDETPTQPKGETGSKVIQKNQTGPRNESKGCNKWKWGQGKLGLQNNKEKLTNKEPPIEKVKWDVVKVKCFNYDNNGHMAKDYLKPP